MNDTELDQLLNRWETPAPSSGLRRRVLVNVSPRERRGFGKPLRWGLAMAAASCVLALGMAQGGGHSALASLADGVQHVTGSVSGLMDEMWCSHILSHFLGSQPKVYVDGELQSDATYAAKWSTMWLRTPGEGKYYIALRPNVFEGNVVPPPTGRFDGHVLEFQLAGKVVRIESRHTYGFGGERPIYAMGPVAGR